MQQSSLYRVMGLALLTFGASLMVIVVCSVLVGRNRDFPLSDPLYALVGVILLGVGLSLIRQFDYTHPDPSLDFENSVVLQDEVEAQFLSQSLDQHHIPYYIVTNHTSAYGNLFEVGNGWGIVRSPRKFHEQIRMAIKALREG